MYLYLYLSTFKRTCILLKYFSKNNAIYLYLYFNKCESTCTLLKYFHMYFTPFLTKATAIQFINGKCHIMKRKSHKTTLSGYYTCVSRDLLLMALGTDTHTHTDAQTKTISKTRRAAKGRVHLVYKYLYILDSQC